MIEKYQNDKKFRNRVNFIGYAVFIVFIIIYASVTNFGGVSSLKSELNDSILNNNGINNSEINLIEDKQIVLPDNYKYDINISINNEKYNFNGEYKDNILTINKVYKDSYYEYVNKEDNYYISGREELIDRQKVYDPVMYDYINISSINKYLEKAQYDGNNYKVYLKDIILGNTSNKYIVINYSSNLDDINIEVDYTSLFNYFNNSIEKYMVIMKYNKTID